MIIAGLGKLGTKSELIQMTLDTRKLTETFFN